MNEIERAKRIIIDVGLWFDAHGDPDACDRVQSLIDKVDTDFIREVNACTIAHQPPAFQYHTICIALKRIGALEIATVDKIHLELNR